VHGSLLAPRASLGDGGSTAFSAADCTARFDAAGAPLQRCEQCTAPWLLAVDAGTGTTVCRCMAECRGGAARPVPALGNWSDAWDNQAVAARGVRLLLGLGTGRCGTVSLSRLLAAQTGAAGTVSHEQHPLIPWAPLGGAAEQLRLVDRRVRLLLQRRVRWRGAGVPVVADVASFYLPHAALVLALEPGARLVVLRRARAAVVASFLAKDKEVDLWRACANTSGWGPNTAYWASAFPKYACTGPQAAADTAAALGRYWDDYYAAVAALAARFPGRVRLLDSPQLFDDAVEQKAMLAWAGFEQPVVRVHGAKHNCVANCRQALAAQAPLGWGLSEPADHRRPKRQEAVLNTT